MAAATLDSPAGPRTRRWTRAEFHRLAELGFFNGQRAELIEGEIVVLSPQKPRHWTAVDRTQEVLKKWFGAGFVVRMQGPVSLDNASEPEPDVCVVRGSRQDFAQVHPTDPVLVVEVSDTTLAYDRGTKAGLYAGAGVADYWVLNLVDLRLEVYRTPGADPFQTGRYHYESRQDLVPPATVTPLALPGAAVPVADLLGPPPPAPSGTPAP